MLALEEASQVVQSSARQLGSERVDLAMAVDRVLAEDVICDIDMPPFDRSAMDGYACRRSDLANELLVVETIRAGYVPKEKVGKNQCAKIMTGSVVPQGADCVIMVELTKMQTANTIRFIGRETANNIRPKAQDLRAGEVVLRSGTLIRAQHIAILATFGCIKPCVSQQPRVGVISTGDELVIPSEKPRCSQIRESNGYQLSAQIKQMCGIARNLGIVPDFKQDIDMILRKAIVENDVVVLSGGVSAGDYDYVPEIMKQIGFDVIFHKIAIKPGKPTVFGVCNNVYCFGLPGNPVASFVVFEVLVKPFLYKIMGHVYKPAYSYLQLSESVKRKKTERQSWIPIYIDDIGEVRPIEYHGSAHISALCRADGLIHLDTGVSEIEKGMIVEVRLI
ncbi:MAG: molybdopterin molybdotransferase MoeA [Planctomycetes bacterium]|nr:molybdopterin molybdotransferase MoeA [Planctomycetota bacterium]